ncbi:MAG: polysaccharide biosynthesis C-terminal domain-containing protein [Thermodesulfobacteriales bacterium]
MLALLLLFRYFIPGITIDYAVIALGISWLLCSLSSLLAAFFTHERHIFKSKPAYNARLWLSNAYPFLVNTLVLSTLSAGTLILLEVLHVSGSEIGIYAAASRTAVLLIVLMNQGDRFYLPQISIAIYNGNTDEINRILRTRFKALGLLSILFLIPIIFFGKNILGLFGEGFSKGYHILLIFSVGMTIDTLGGISLGILQVLGKNSLSLRISLFILIANIGLNILFVPIWGLEAAVILVNTSLAAVNIFSAIYLLRYHGIRVI